MKGEITIFFLLIYLCFCNVVQGQKVQYSRQTIKNPYAASMQLVGNIGGYHHLLFFNENKSPVIQVFDSRLQLYSKKEIDFKIRSNSDIRVIRFKEYYYLYVHVLKSADHDLFKIDGQGNIHALSKELRLVISRDLNQTQSTIQLINHKEQLHIIAHTYFDDIRRIGSSMIELNSELNVVNKRKALYSFNYREDRLQQFLFTDDFLLVLKKSRNAQTGNSLDLIKVDLQSGKSFINSFNSASHLYTDPAFSFNKKDSTILVYSMLREPLNSSVMQRSIVFIKLDDSLKEVTPVKLLQDQFKNNTTINFLLLGGASSFWINMSNNLRYQGNSNTTSLSDFDINDPANADLAMPPVYFSGYDQPKAVRFTVLDEAFKIVNDSLIANKKIYNVQPRPFAQFTLHQKPSLLLVQNLTSRQKTLLLVNTDVNGRVNSTDIRVVNKYDCLLPQLQVIDETSVIFPYLYKNEIGLIKLTVDK